LGKCWCILNCQRNVHAQELKEELMPKALEKLARKLRKTGKSKSSSYAIATSALQKKGKMKKKRKKKK
jgi:hypothetical protein